ncbi:MAG: hypothetical protein M3R00_09580 [Pseudomonadota bacterium]|nr:hypothetical protein [Pseudomonadota bacterium]
MSKFKAFIATLLLIPSLAFAADQCANFTDQNFRDMLTIGPQTGPIDAPELGLTGTMTIEFHKNGIVDQHINFKLAEGSGTFDAKAKWNVTNAMLNLHLTSAKHSDTHNKKLNKELDAMIKDMKANPDISVSMQDLGLCDGKRSIQSLFQSVNFLKK